MRDPNEICISTRDAALLESLLRTRRAAGDAAAAARLAEFLREARVVADALLPPDRVAIGSTVTWLHEPNGRLRTVQLCLPAAGEAHDARRLSVASATGLALLGRKAGSRLIFTADNGWPMCVRIAEVAREEEMA